MAEPKPSLRHRISAHKSWAATENRSARTKPGRAAFDAKFLAEAGGDPQRAASARKAFFLELAKKSADARAARKGDDVDHDA